jgi:hypothetical protein
MKYHQRQSVIVGIWTNHSNGWLTKAQGRLFHEATRQSHPLTGAEIFRDPLEVLYPFPFEEWITWFSFWIKAMKSGLLDLYGSLWIPKLQINQSFHSNGHMCISRGSIALQQHVRPSFWSSWWVVSWSNFRYCAYQTTEIVSIQQRVHSYLRSVHLSSTWYFKLYIYVHTHIYNTIQTMHFFVQWLYWQDLIWWNSAAWKWSFFMCRGCPWVFTPIWIWLSIIWIWHIYGIFIVYLWYIYGISMIYLWYIKMVYLWYMDSQSTYHNWLTPEICQNAKGFTPETTNFCLVFSSHRGAEAWRLHSSPTFPPGSVPATPRVQWCLGLEKHALWMGLIYPFEALQICCV